MALLFGMGDWGLTDIYNNSVTLYNMLLDLCTNQLDWENVLNKPDVYEKSETYSRDEVDDLIENIDPGAHTHVITDVTGLDSALNARYTKTQVDTFLLNKSNVGHTHDIEDIIGLEAAIAAMGVNIVSELPIPVVNGKVYMLFPPGATRFSTWISSGGDYIALDAVTYSALNTALNAKQNKFTGEITDYIRGDGSTAEFSKAAIGLGLIPNLAPEDWPISDAVAAALALKANDSAVVHKTGNETITSGVKDFKVSPLVPIATQSAQAVNLGQVETLIAESVGEPLELDEIDLVEYKLLSTGSNDRELDIAALILSGQPPETLTAKLIHFPPWITDIEIDRGTNDELIDLTWSGAPDKAGRYQIVIEIRTGTNGLYLISIPITVYPAVDSTITVIDIYDAVKPEYPLSRIPGAYVLPEKLGMKATVTGLHNQIQVRVTGGSDFDNPIDISYTRFVPESTLATYDLFETEGGLTVPEGLFVAEFIALYEGVQASYNEHPFTLYVPATLAKVVFELWNRAANTKISNVLISDASVFQYVDSFEVKTIVTGLPHNKAVITETLDGEVLKVTTYNHVSPVSNQTYYVYPGTQTGRLPGNYVVYADFELAGEKTHERYCAFEVLAKKVEPEEGITYGTMIPGTANFVPIQALPVTGFETDKTTDGFNLCLDVKGKSFDFIEWYNYRLLSGQFVPIDTFPITGKYNYIEYDKTQTEASILAFWDKSSIDLGIHIAPATVRTKFRLRKGGQTGDIISVVAADVTLRDPVDPSLLSGLRFLHDFTLVDSNMLKTGKTYQIPKPTKKWLVSARKAPGGVEFDEYTTFLSKNGVDLHFAGAGYVVNGTVPPTTELPADDYAYIFGLGAGGSRTLKNPSNVDVPIDEPGSYVARVEFKRLGTVVGNLQSAFQLIKEVDIPVVPESGCCGGESFSIIIGNGAATDFSINHNLDSLKLQVTIRETATYEEIQVDNRAVTVNQMLVSFYEAPANGSHVVIVKP